MNKIQVIKILTLRLQNLCLLGACLLLSGISYAEDVPVKQELSKVSETVANQLPEKPVALSVAELKKQVIKLNRDLFILEEDLLFPANTQFVVYLSLDTGKFFKPDSVKLKLNDELVAAHLYTPRQIKALQRGGMQRLHIGNLKSGEHEMTVILDGQGPDNRTYKNAASIVFEKGSDIASLEVRVQDHSENYQPSVEIVEWN